MEGVVAVHLPQYKATAVKEDQAGAAGVRAKGAVVSGMDGPAGAGNGEITNLRHLRGPAIAPREGEPRGGPKAR